MHEELDATRNNLQMQTIQYLYNTELRTKTNRRVRTKECVSEDESVDYRRAFLRADSSRSSPSRPMRLKLSLWPNRADIGGNVVIDSAVRGGTELPLLLCQLVLGVGYDCGAVPDRIPELDGRPKFGPYCDDAEAGRSEYAAEGAEL